jgi:opacity protein-like surface antigen
VSIAKEEEMGHRPATPWVLLLAAAVAAAAPSVGADSSAPDGRVRVAATVGGSVGQFGSHLAAGGLVGYRFSRSLSFEVEVTAIPDGDPEAFASGPRAGGGIELLATRFTPLLSLVTRSSLSPVPRDADAWLVTANVRREFTSEVERLRPYLSAGFGIARVETSFSVFTLGGVVLPPSLPGRGDLLPLVGPGQLDLRQVDQAETDLTLAAGGGLSLRVWRGLSLDLDARYYRLLDPGRNVGRFAPSLSYRF